MNKWRCRNEIVLWGSTCQTHRIKVHLEIAATLEGGTRSLSPNTDKKKSRRRETAGFSSGRNPMKTRRKKTANTSRARPRASFSLNHPSVTCCMCIQHLTDFNIRVLTIVLLLFLVLTKFSACLKPIEKRNCVKMFCKRWKTRVFSTYIYHGGIYCDDIRWSTSPLALPIEICMKEINAHDDAHAHISNMFTHRETPPPLNTSFNKHLYPHDTGWRKSRIKK